MKRNYGIDLLRMLSMLMIVAVHVLGHGGLLSAVRPLSGAYYAVCLIESTVSCTVNCFSLISGYVNFGGKYRVSSLLQIYLRALLYSLGIALCVWCVKPELFSLGNLLAFSLPVSMNRYWYFSAYTGMFLLIPVLNAGIAAFTQKQAKCFLLSLFLLFTLMPTLSGFDPFALSYGYGTLWLAVLYLAGGCIRRFGWGENWSGRRCVLVFFGAVLFSWAWKTGLETATTLLLSEKKSFFDFNSYTSPTMVIAAAALFFTFKNLTVSPKLTKFIAAFSPACFGVYLIHDHRYIRDLLISGRFASWAGCNALTVTLQVFAAVLLIFTLCLLIDYLMCRIFLRLKVKARLEALERRAAALLFSEESSGVN